MTATAWLFIAAALASAVLGVAAIARPPRNLFRWSFALGMVGVAGEALSAFALVTLSNTPEQHLLWLRIMLIVGLLLMIPWALFVVTLSRPRAARLSRRVWLSLGAGALAAIACAVAVALGQAFEVAD